MDDELFAQITQLKSDYDDAINRINVLESERDELISILLQNGIAVPDKILAQVEFDKECSVPLE